MKRAIIICSLLLCTLFTYGQGIQFEENLNWKQVFEKAEKENKYIFVDCYATWCVPCKKMDREVFTKQMVGEFYNKNFISVKIQFDSTVKDTEHIKSLFETAELLQKTYNVGAFPTYLFFSPKGVLVTKLTGGMPEDDFLNRSKSVLNPEEQYYTLLSQYKNGDESSRLVKKLIPEAVRLQDWGTVQALHEKFVAQLDTPYTQTDIVAVYVGIKNSSSTGFNFLLKDMEKYNSILKDDGRVQGVLKNHLYVEAYERFVKGHESKPDWKNIARYIDGKAPVFTQQIIMLLQVNIAHDKKDWEKFGKLKMDFYDAFAKKFDHNDSFWMNNDLMEVFRMCSNKTTLLRAAEWSKHTLDNVFGPDNVDAMDTYANLLYKAGEVKKAIGIQRQVIALVSTSKRRDKEDFAKTLQKMESGNPTWN